MMTWEQVTKYSGQGFTGDDLWKVIIDASQRSNKIVNTNFGFKF